MKRRRVWLWVLGALGAILLIAVAIVWDAHRRADAVITRHQVESRDLLEAFRARSAVRPAFDGEGVEGNAWDVYRGVLAQMGSLPADERDALDFETNGVAADDEGLGVLFLKYEPQLRALRDGLNRKVVDPGVVGGGDDAFDFINPALSTARFMGAAVAHYHRMSRCGQAVEMAELGLGYAQDVGRRSCVLGLLVRNLIEQIFTSNLMVLLESHGLTSDVLEAFARRLDMLDASRPSSEIGWESEEVYMRCVLSVDAWVEAAKSIRGLVGARHLWSLKLARAQALEQLPMLFEDGRSVLRRPSHERAAEVDRLAGHWERTGNVILATVGPGTLKTIKSDVTALRGWRMLRLAVAIAWYEVEKAAFPTALQDLVPRHAARIPTDPTNGKAFGYAGGKIWAAGPDGVDNGGAADLLNPEEPRDGFDVVWTVSRRE